MDFVISRNDGSISNPVWATDTYPGISQRFGAWQSPNWGTLQLVHTGIDKYSTPNGFRYH